MHDTQDKQWWCSYGETEEYDFIKEHGNHLGLIINPAKYTNPYAIDLFDLKRLIYADLKTSKTPFFKAKELYGFNPQNTVVINVKDVIHYVTFKDLDVYFLVNWTTTSYKGREVVVPMKKIFKIPLPILKGIIKDAPIHTYKKRKKDLKGNAKKSYVLDLSLIKPLEV